MKYLYPTQILYLHKRILEVSGGTPGLRDQNLLESAVYRPQAAFGGSDLYPDLFSKAAALGCSIIKNHPFIDGNKRVGLEAMRLFLRLNGQDLKATGHEKLELAVKIADESNLDEPAIAKWIQSRSKPS